MFLPIVLGPERGEDVRQDPIHALEFLVAVEYFLYCPGRYCLQESRFW